MEMKTTLDLVVTVSVDDHICLGHQYVYLAYRLLLEWSRIHLELILLAL